MVASNEERNQYMALNLGEMTTQEKLKAMEMLWDDICRSAPDFSSPSWHEDVLKEREQRIREGKDKFLDWDQAKKDILDSVP
jgi:Putative addiction module component